MNQFKSAHRAEHKTQQHPCPDCGNVNTLVSSELQEFMHDAGKDAVVISCRVPVVTCQTCGSAWTGSEAEDIRHAAVCRYLGRLSPAEILDIREGHGLSQSEFSRLTGFGEASLCRWETGAQIQNASSDRFLRLLKADAGNLEKLRLISAGTSPGMPTFRAIAVTPQLIQRSRQFQLRPQEQMAA